MTLPLFESPIDVLMVIDDGLISVAGLWWMSRLVAPQRHADLSRASVLLDQVRLKGWTHSSELAGNRVRS